MQNAISLGPIGRIPKGEARAFKVDGLEIAVYHTHAGEVFATQAVCPHKIGPLADGLIGGATILCPLHDRLFDLRDGRNLSGDCEDLRTYKVALDAEGRIMLDLAPAAA